MYFEWSYFGEGTKKGVQSWGGLLGRVRLEHVYSLMGGVSGWKMEDRAELEDLG